MDNEDSCLIAVTDQASKRILVLDISLDDWNDDRVIKWSWYPNSDNGFTKLATAWGLPSDVKLRHSPHYESLCMLVTDTNGLVAIIPYPDASAPIWSLVVGGNPHASELLPDGNIAIAA